MRRITLRLVISAIGVSILGILLIFTITNYGHKYEQIETKPVKCDCPVVEKIVIQTVPAVVNTISPNISRIPIFKICNETQQSSPVQRAIIIYYPHHQGEYFFPEVRW